MGALFIDRIIRAEDIRKAAFELAHDLVKHAKRDALLAMFQAMEGGSVDAELPGKGSIGDLAPLLANEGG